MPLDMTVSQWLRLGHEKGSNTTKDLLCSSNIKAGVLVLVNTAVVCQDFKCLLFKMSVASNAIQNG